VEALATKLDVLLGDKELRRLFGLTGRQYVLSKFSPDHYRESLTRIIAEYTK
jgi:hypothetical protein